MPVSRSRRAARRARGGPGARDRHLVTVLAPEVDAATLEGVDGPHRARAAATSSGSCASPRTRCTATSCPWPAPISTGCGGPWPRRPPARQVDLAVQAARAAPAGQAPDRDGRRLHPAAGRGDRPAGRALAAAARRWRPSPRRPWRVTSISPTRCASRVRLLAGLKEADLEAVRDGILLAPGARTLVRTLKRLGYELAVVSGGFTQVIEPLVAGPGHRPPGGQRPRPRRRGRHGRAGRARSSTGPARRPRWPASPPRPASRSPAPSRWATGRTTSTCWRRPGSASRSTPSPSCAGRPTRHSACPISTPSSSCSASRAARSSWPTGWTQEVAR